MNYHCENGNHEWITDSIVCCCGEVEKGFKGTAGELEKMEQDLKIQRGIAAYQDQRSPD